MGHERAVVLCDWAKFRRYFILISNEHSRINSFSAIRVVCANLAKLSSLISEFQATLNNFTLYSFVPYVSKHNF